MKKESKAHRGRIQAQGNDLEKSESWAKDEPLSLDEGLSLIENLKKQLTPAELKKREKSFEKLEKFVRKSPTGFIAVVRRSFSDDDSSERVDLEILQGLAFKH